jgi:hypothetical protein
MPFLLPIDVPIQVLKEGRLREDHGQNASGRTEFVDTRGVAAPALVVLAPGPGVGELDGDAAKWDVPLLCDHALTRVRGRGDNFDVGGLSLSTQEGSPHLRLWCLLLRQGSGNWMVTRLNGMCLCYAIML